MPPLTRRPVSGLIAAALTAGALTGCTAAEVPVIEVLEREWVHDDAHIVFDKNGTWQATELPSSVVGAGDEPLDGGGTWSAVGEGDDDQILTLTVAPSEQSFELHLVYGFWDGYQIRTPPGGEQVSFNPR